MTRLVLAAIIAALASASTALALGGSLSAHISANWGTPGIVDVTVLSNHSFHGTVSNSCVATASGASNTDETQQLDSWVFNEVAHLYEIDTSFDISAAGAGANCMITVMSGRKLLAEQSYVSA
jgi:hypothetical protein